MLIDAPPVLYQTVLDEDGRQNSGKLLHLAITLHDGALADALRGDVAAAAAARRGGAAAAKSKLVGVDEAAAAASALLAEYVHGAIRRYDGRELEEFCEEAGGLLGLRMPAAAFVYSLRAGAPVLDVCVHRKYLPVSSCYGGAPFIFAFAIAPQGVQPAVVTTARFFGASKEPRADAAAAAAAKPEPKRARGPASTKSYAAAPCAMESLVSASLTTAAVPVVTAAPVAAAAAAAAALPLTPPQASAGVKRGREAAASAPVPAVAPAVVVPAVAPAAKRVRGETYGSLSEFAATALPPLPSPVEGGLVRSSSVLSADAFATGMAAPLGASFGAGVFLAHGAGLLGLRTFTPTAVGVMGTGSALPFPSPLLSSSASPFLPPFLPALACMSDAAPAYSEAAAARVAAARAQLASVAPAAAVEDEGDDDDDDGASQSSLSERLVSDFADFDDATGSDDSALSASPVDGIPA